MRISQKFLSIMLLAVLTLGCVNAQAETWLDKRYRWAKKAVAESQGALVVEQILGMFDEPDGDKVARDFVIEYPIARTYVLENMKSRTFAITDPDEAKGIRSRIEKLSSGQCISEADSSALLTAVDRQLVLLADSGALSLDQIPQARRQDLKPEQIQVLVKKSVEKLQQPFGSSQREIATALALTLKGQERNGLLFSQVKEKLPTLYLTEENLRLFADVFPEVVATKVKGGLINVPQGVWDDLNSEQKRGLGLRFIVSPIAATNYGTVMDAQVINDSTAGTNTGSKLGAAYGSAAYVDSAFSGTPRNWNYSATSQVTAALVGGIVGSLLDTKPEARYRARYTIRSGLGAVGYVDDMSSTALKHSVGVCVSIDPLQPIANEVCAMTKDKFLSMYAPDLNVAGEVYCKFATVPIPVKLPQSVCLSAGGSVLR
jgi:hypothetical protein